MSKDLERKLLAECFDAIVNDGDVAKATRLFKRHWDSVAKSQYSLLESADEDFEVNDMGDEFNDEMMDKESDSDEKFEQALVAVDELEEKYNGEDSEELQSKLDDLRNIIDEMKLGGEEDSAEDASVIIEDLKGEFESADCMDDEVSDLFDEISTAICGDESCDEVDVADEDSAEDAEEGLEDTDVEVDEGCGKPVKEAEDVEDAEKDMGTDVEFEDKEPEVDGDAEELGTEEPKEDADEEDVIYDIKDDVEELLAKLEDLEDKDEKPVEEGFEKIADPRKKMSSEGEGVNKKGTMNFGKLRGLTLDKGAKLGTSSADSKGISADKKVKVQSIENKGAKSWHKVEKPANKPANDKSLLGK